MSSFERVTVAASGTTWLPVSISIEIGIDQAARNFEAQLPASPISIPAAMAALANGPAVTITAGGGLILTGWLEGRDASLEADGGQLTVSGRSKSADLVDCSHDHPEGFFRGKDVTAIARELDTAGIGVEADEPGETRKTFKANAGESVFAAANRLCRGEDMTITDTPEGKLKILKPKGERHAGGLIEGRTIAPGSRATHDMSGRFSKVKVRGQLTEGHGAESLEIEAEARDAAVGRNRIKILIPAEQLDKAKAQARAKRFRDRAAGRSVTAEIVTFGWRDGGGALWRPGWLVYVESAYLGLAQDMLIERVRLEQSNEGTRATLSLVDPKAYGAKGGKGGKSSAQWDLGAIGAEDV
jgi:prophage tail gpP-like protein